MRDDLPPFARFVFGIASFAMAATGLTMWLVGSVLSLTAGLFLALIHNPTLDGGLWASAIGLLGALALQAIGAAMHFFSQKLIAYNPQKVPTDLLPRWWLAQFISPLCLQLAIVSGIGVFSCMIRLDPIVAIWAFGLWAGIRGFKDFRMKTIELSPPYPPRSGPPKWETRG